MRRLRPCMAALAVALLTAACAGTPTPTRSVSQEERDAFAAGLAPLPERPELATERLEFFLRSFPDGPLADDASEKLAALALARGDTDRALQWLRSLLDHYADGDRSASARLTLAGLENQRGNPTEAKRLLGRLRFADLSPLQRRVAYRLGSDLADRPDQRVRWLAGLREASTEPEQAEVDAELDDVLRAMSSGSLERARSGLDGRVPSGRIALHMAARALDASDLEQAAELLGSAGRDTLTQADRGLAEQLQVRIDNAERMRLGDRLPSYADVAAVGAPRTDGASGTLGVLLPLSGPFAHYGEMSLQGVLLAAGIFEARAADASVDEKILAPFRRMKVIVRDTRGDAETAAEAVRELARRDDLVAIVGPLLSAEAEAAAREAEIAGVPLLSLTSREEIAHERSYVLRLRTTPRDEVRALVEYAIERGDASRFAILYPADAFGRGMRRYFWDAVNELGGHVVAVASYSPNATDFADPIRSLIGYPLLTEGEKEAVRERERALRRARRLPPEQAGLVRKVLYAMLGPEGDPLPPIVDFDALFVPDSHDKIVLIAPQLSFHDIRGVQLLGSAGWIHPDLVRIGRGHVRGAVISALFHAESAFTFVADFVENFARTYGVVPDVFAAGGYDAANLVLLQLVAGRESRLEVRDGLHGVVGYAGASGIATVLPDGNVRKRPFLLGVGRRGIVSLD